MASLIIHGDINDPGPSLSAPLYVRPVMAPDAWPQEREIPPSDRLLVDVLHDEALRRIAGGREPAAPSVRIVNVQQLHVLLHGSGSAQRSHSQHLDR